MKSKRAIVKGRWIASLGESLGLCLLIIACGAGCNSDSSSGGADASPGPQTVDASSQLLAQVSGTRLYSRGMSLAMGNDGSFELIMSPQINFSNLVSGSNHSIGSGSCSVRLAGTVHYYSTHVVPRNDGLSDIYTNQLEFTVSSATLLSAGTDENNDPAALPSPQLQSLCQGYAAELVSQSTFDATLVNSGTNFIELSNLNLSSPWQTGGTGYYASFIDSLGYYSSDGDTFFVQKGATIDVTSSAMNDLAGNYKVEDQTSNVSLTVNNSLKELDLKENDCGFESILAVNSITTDGTGYWVKGDVVESNTYAGDLPAVDQGDCPRYKRAFDDFATNGLKLSYSVWKSNSSSGNCGEILLAPLAGSDAVQNALAGFEFRFYGCANSN
jgi:hypothetical protein